MIIIKPMETAGTMRLNCSSKSLIFHNYNETLLSRRTPVSIQIFSAFWFLYVFRMHEDVIRDVSPFLERKQNTAYYRNIVLSQTK